MFLMSFHINRNFHKHMEQYFYPGPSAQVYHKVQWEPWNRLRTASSGLRSSKRKMTPASRDYKPNYQKPSSRFLAGKSLSTKPVRITESGSIINKPSHSKRISILTLDELLLLEDDLFSEQPQIKLSNPITTVNKRMNKHLIELKGTRTGVLKENKIIPKSNKNFLVKTKPLVLKNHRSFSVSKKAEKKIKIDTPTPWGVDPSIDNSGIMHKGYKYQSTLSFQDNFTST